MYGKSNMEAYITVCKIDNQWELPCLRNLNRALHQPRGAGWGGRSEESSRGRDLCIPHRLIHVEV